MVAKEIKNEIDEITGHMDCPKSFTCVESRFENLCRVKEIVKDDLFECLEDAATNCSLSLAFGYAYFCQCPLRIFLAKKLKN